MRRDGQKRPREEVQADPGHIVHVTINRQTDGIGAAAYSVVRSRAIPWKLQQVQIVSMTGDDIVLCGLQPIGACWENCFEPQAWWLRLSSSEETEPGIPRQRALTSGETKTDEGSSKGGISTPIGEK